MDRSHHQRHDPHRRGAGRPAWPAPAARDDSRPETSSDPAEVLRDERLTLSVTEAAAVLGISRALAYELVARGELPALHLGRRLLVPKAALLGLLGLAGPRGS
jgi:excisionase family DNA binding protein